MDQMFCFQCEQTARLQSERSHFTGCTRQGVCGKKPEIAHDQDELVCEMIALATAVQKSGVQNQKAVDKIVDGLFTCLSNVNFDAVPILKLKDEIAAMTKELGGSSVVEPDALFFEGEDDIISLRSTLLFGLKGMAAYAHHARVLGKSDPEVDAFFITGMAAFIQERSVPDWLTLIMDFGKVNYKCMALLDEGNTSTYGNPTPVEVPLLIEKGPFIVVSGHDLHDLKMLLDQVEGKGVNIYTHGEMLPAHGYPELRKYPQLKGNFGTAWQNQQVEFVKYNLPAPVLFTTNCIMPPKEAYADRIYTTAVVGYPELVYVPADENGQKDFSILIDQAIALGGYPEDTQTLGTNGGTMMRTGFGRQTVLDNAPAIIDAVKAGAIKHFFLVGSCDGRKPQRGYYTDFVKMTPEDSIVLTLACGKYRFNDLDIGSIGPFPRILDMGQCNDAYGAIQVALALADAFNCGVNDLPLSLVLSWYEQKAVCVLLTLLALGVKDIYIGPSLPAFYSDNVLKTLVEMFDLHPITTPEADMAAILE